MVSELSCQALWGEVRIRRNREHLDAQLFQLGVMIGEVAKLGRADEREVGGIEEEDRPFSRDVGVGDVDEFALLVGLRFERFDLGIDESHEFSPDCGVRASRPARRDGATTAVQHKCRRPVKPGRHLAARPRLPLVLRPCAQRGEVMQNCRRRIDSPLCSQTMTMARSAPEGRCLPNVEVTRACRIADNCNNRLERCNLRASDRCLVASPNEQRQLPASPPSLSLLSPRAQAYSLGLRCASAPGSPSAWR